MGQLHRNLDTLEFGADLATLRGVMERAAPVEFDSLYAEILGGFGDRPQRAEPLALMQNRPNPFNPTTIIEFTLPKRGRVLLAVYDVRGRLVDKLVEGTRPAGRNSAEWNASSASSGVYFYRLEAGGSVLTRKMVLLK